MAERIPGAGECAVPGCPRNAQRNQLMCRPCWFSVSPGTRARVNTTWRAYQANNATLGELREAQQQAIREAE